MLVRLGFHKSLNIYKIRVVFSIRFPWESAYTGVEVTQPCCPEVAEFEQHISGCIAFAARQFLATTRNEEWLEVRLRNMTI